MFNGNFIVSNGKLICWLRIPAKFCVFWSHTPDTLLGTSSSAGLGPIFPSALPLTLHATDSQDAENISLRFWFITTWLTSLCDINLPKVRRSGDCGGHLSTVNGHVQETSLRGSDVVNRKTVLLESFIKRVGWGQRQYSGWLLCLTNAPLVLRRTKWENIPQTTSFDDTCEL